ncbi:MAG: hypothetical protein WA729_19145 [Pseudolabrys sp.]
MACDSFARRGCRARVGVPARPLRRCFIRNVGRKLAFVLAAFNHGTMIINRFDYRMSGRSPGIGAGGGTGGGGGIGGGADIVDVGDAAVGHQLVDTANFDPVEIELAVRLLEARRGKRRQYRRAHHRMGHRDDRLGLG